MNARTSHEPDTEFEVSHRARPSVFALFSSFVFDTLFSWIGNNVRLIAREADLFLGNALLLIGLLNFESDKYCDGNTADYLSCTRPSTYYYFDWLDILLIVVGSTLVLAWLLKRRS